MEELKIVVTWIFENKVISVLGGLVVILWVIGNCVGIENFIKNGPPSP